MSRLKDRAMKLPVSRFTIAAAALVLMAAAPAYAQVAALSTNGTQSTGSGAQPNIAPPPAASTAAMIAPPPNVAGGVAQVVGDASAVGQGLAGYLPGQQPEPEKKIKYVYNGPGPLNGVELPTRLFNNIPPRFAPIDSK